MTLHEQKTALAEWAPDLLTLSARGIVFRNSTAMIKTPIGEWEWLEVAWRLEQRLDDKQHEQFRAWLCVTIEQDRVPKNFTLAEAMAIADRNERKYASATALQRLEALCRTLFPERFK